jgi:hypothetical protein
MKDLFAMKIANVILLGLLLPVINTVSAGTLTIKAPPQGLDLRISSHGTIKHGDNDLILVGATNTTQVISPEVVTGTPAIIGYLNITHHEGDEFLYGNDITCEIKAPYSVTVNIVGFKEETCSGSRKFFTQLRSEGASDVILTFNND